MSTYSYTGHIEKVTVAETGTYQIAAYGAQGGAGYHGPTATQGTPGGDGAEVAGSFHLTKGEVLEIVVGGQGQNGYFGAGGGGGSFVLAGNGSGTYSLLEAAGGGGGGGFNNSPTATYTSGRPGVASVGGSNANGPANDAYGGSGAGGQNGAGGSAAYDGGGGGGAGVKGDGGGTFTGVRRDPHTYGGSNGSGGYKGGIGGFQNGGIEGHGGFGGGGGGGYGAVGYLYGGVGSFGGGGGGGYSGGGGGGFFYGGGGGGSFDAGANAVETSGVHAGAGLVTLELESPCYCPGTLIATPRGEVAVERLAIGDEVMTASGALRPIKWIGRRSYGGRFIMGRKNILPVCIKAGAIDDNLPKRDLWISPHHAMYFEDESGGVLVEARDLVNGVSIVQAERVEEVAYFHIELDTHDVILAEGAPSESFVDDDSRNMFHNVHEYNALYEHEEMTPARYCVPRLDQGYEVEAIRRKLATRAGLGSVEHDAGALRGYIDAVSPRLIEGWAQSVRYPEAPVCLNVYVGGQLIGQTLANHYREDLERAGLGSGRHAFDFAPPIAINLAAETIEVRRSLDGAALPLSADRRRRVGAPAA
ncbi:MAG: Hint domain-containing protein [Bradyrhizobium sp.]